MQSSRRWADSDFDPWLATRLIHRWGGEAQAWAHKLRGFQSNDYLFITNGEAVLLAMQLRDIMTGAPIIMERFAWSRLADEKDGCYGITARSDGVYAMRDLYRQLREWGKSLKATRQYIGICSDMTTGMLRSMLGDDSYYVVASPC